MSVKCPKCQHINETIGLTGQCDVCGWVLKTASTASDRVSGLQRPKPIKTPVTETKTGSKSRQSSSIFSSTLSSGTQNRIVKRQESVPDKSRSDISVTGSQRTIIPITPPITTNRSIQQLNPGELEGTVQNVIDMANEPPDFDIFRFLTSLFLVIDMVILLGTVGYFLLIALIVLFILAMIFRAPWMMGIVGFMVQGFFYFLNPLIRLFGRERPTVKVTNYVVHARNGRNYTFRIKGQLRGATPNKQDHVRIQGSARDGILRFQSGENLDTNEPFLLPVNLSPLWFILLIGANVFVYLYLNGALR